MKFYSELTKKFYDSADACNTAEKEFNAAVAEKEKREKELKANRKARADEVSNAYKAVQAAEKNFHKLRDQFIKDYGSFHMTFTNTDEDEDVFSSFFDPFRFLIN